MARSGVGDRPTVGRLFAGFTGAAPAFKAARDAFDGQPEVVRRPTLAGPPELIPAGPPSWGPAADSSAPEEASDGSRR